MLLLIDNYDSFTWNLVQYFGALGQEVVVKRNDELTLDTIAAELVQFQQLLNGAESQQRIAAFFKR